MRSYKCDHRNPRRLRYGWRLTASGHIVVDPAQRRCIFLMLELRAAGLSLRQICEVLRAGHYRPPRHDIWYCATVKKIIEQNAHLKVFLGRYAASAGVAALPLREPDAAVDDRHPIAALAS